MSEHNPTLNIDPDILSQFQEFARLSRGDILNGPMPQTRQEMAALPRMGVVGSRYKKKGIALVGINPGSGGDRSERIFTDRDKLLIQATKVFWEKGDTPSLQALIQVELNDMRYWTLDWAISGTLDRLKLQLDDVAFTNVLPFSSKQSSNIKEAEWKNAVDLYFAKWLAAIEPGTVIWLGKKAFDKASKYHDLSKIVSVVVSRERSLSMEKRFQKLDEMPWANGTTVETRDEL